MVTSRKWERNNMITGITDYKSNDYIKDSNDKSPIKAPLEVYDETGKYITIEEHRSKYPGQYFYFM